MFEEKKVAIVHDWLNGMRGGEYVLEAIIELFPRADLFTLLHEPGSVSKKIESLPIQTSPLQKIPYARRHYRNLLPLLPYFAEHLDLEDYDLVISSSHCVAKGVRKNPKAFHISYVHAPMRYMWDRFDDYFGTGRAGIGTRAAAHVIRPFLKRWDRKTARESRIDTLVANSRFIAEQIRRAYGRDSQVIYPFVDFERFQRPRDPKNFYLIVSAFAPYKKLDLAISAFNQMGIPLKIVGTGQDESRLKSIAGPTIEFLGFQTNEQIAELYRQCRGFVFPGVEDFGITPLEAMAAGAPVVAVGRGGVLETVTEKTGLFFRDQTADGLKNAVMQLENGSAVFSEQECRDRSREFSRGRFKQDLSRLVEALPH